MINLESKTPTQISTTHTHFQKFEQKFKIEFPANWTQTLISSESVSIPGKKSVTVKSYADFSSALTLALFTAFKL